MTSHELSDYIDMLSDPQQAANLPHDAYLGWSPEEKAFYLKSVVDCLRQKNMDVIFTDRYYPSTEDAERKAWELELDEEGRPFRAIPVGELDTDNNIYLNIKEIGFISSFLTIPHLYGHRVQDEIRATAPESPDGKHYAAITKYVGWKKPLNMDDVYADYRQITGRPDADYAEDFLLFEKEAFSFGLALFRESGIPIDQKLYYALNTYIVTDFEELKYWWQNQPNKSGDDFNERYEDLYHLYQNDQAFITAHYPPVPPKASPFSTFGTAQNGVVVIRNNNDYTL